LGSPVRRPATAGRLLRLLHLRGPMTRAAATAELGLTRAAVGEAAAELVSIGVLCADPPASSAGRGRPSPVLSFDRSGPVAVAVHLRARRLDVAVFGLGAVELTMHSYSLTDRDTEPEALLTALAGWIADAIDQVARPCAGIGVGLAGMAPSADGLVRSALHLGWGADVPVGAILAGRIGGGLPVRVENDSAMVALAEYRRGAGQGVHTLLVLACEHTGIGGALLGDGLPLPGTGHALEAGHVLINPNGLLCKCGQQGCLEVYADGRALLRAVGAADVEDPARVTRLLGAASAGDPVALASVTKTAAGLGIGLASLVNLLGPDRVVLTGLLGDMYGIAPDVVSARLSASLVAQTNRTELVVGQVERPVLVGAAELAFEELLRRPGLLPPGNPGSSRSSNRSTRSTPGEPG
jgi:predicted NBD/HSP70 family sugar kinase